MTVTTAKPVTLEFADYVLYTESHPDDSFELVDGVILKFAPEGDPHARTRSTIQLYLSDAIDRARFTPYTEVSFPAPGWPDGPKPDNFVARGPWLVNGRPAPRPNAENIALVIDVSSTSRPKDHERALLYAKLVIPEYWVVDLRSAEVFQYSEARGGAYRTCKTLLRGETLESSTVAGLTIAVDFLLSLAEK